MKTFTAKQFHENPREVYQAAVKGAVKVTHSHLGTSFIISEAKSDDLSYYNELFKNGMVKFATKPDITDNIDAQVTLPGAVHEIKIEGVIV